MKSSGSTSVGASDSAVYGSTSSGGLLSLMNCVIIKHQYELRGNDRLTKGSFETATVSSGCSKEARRAWSSRICSSFVGFLVRRLVDGMPAFVFAASVITGAAGCAFLFFGRVPTMRREKG